MDIEAVPDFIRNLTNRIDGLLYALLLAGICPQCGAKTKESDEGNGKRFLCDCKLNYWLSNKAIANLKQGKDIAI